MISIIHLYIKKKKSGTLLPFDFAQNRELMEPQFSACQRRAHRSASMLACLGMAGAGIIPYGWPIKAPPTLPAHSAEAAAKAG